MRSVLVMVVVVMLSVLAACGQSEPQRAIDESRVSIANDGLLILASEYPNDQFDPRYAEQSRTIFPDASCEVIVHEILGIIEGSCAQPMAERSVSFEAEETFGAAGYLLFWNESEAIEYLSLINTVARSLENDTRTVQRDYLSDITRVGLGPAADERSYIYLVPEDGAPVRISLIRIDSVVYYVYEQTTGTVLDRKLSGVSWPDYYDRVLNTTNLSYEVLFS